MYLKQYTNVHDNHLTKMVLSKINTIYVFQTTTTERLSVHREYVRRAGGSVPVRGDGRWHRDYTLQAGHRLLSW